MLNLLDKENSTGSSKIVSYVKKYALNVKKNSLTLIYSFSRVLYHMKKRNDIALDENRRPS